MATKIYTVVKDGEQIKELKTLPAAKKLADTEGAKVFCDGECVYQGIVTATEDTVTDTVMEAPEEVKPVKYKLTAKMNVRKGPSLNAEKIGIAEAGTVVETMSLENDWLQLIDGSFILFQGGKFAARI